MVGVLPGGLSCNGLNLGSSIDIIPGQPKLLTIRLAEPSCATEPVKKHSSPPLLAMIVLRMVREVEAPSSKTTMPPPMWSDVL